jgi:metal-responsive CopG/Arc/MetJ family transcriptional regulator
VEELVIRIEVPKELTQEFKKVLEELVEESRTRLLLTLLEKSRLTESEALELGEKIKHGIAKKHGV